MGSAEESCMVRILDVIIDVFLISDEEVLEAIHRRGRRSHVRVPPPVRGG